MKARAALGLLVVVSLGAAAAWPASAEAPATWQSRMADAIRYAESRAGTISFAVVDESDRVHGYHARAVAPSASVLKAMLLVAYLRRSDVRDRPLQEWERDLLGPMIRRSDNVAAARMVGLVGERRLNRLAAEAGMEHFRLHWPRWGASEITPRGQALYFDRIDKLVPARHRAFAMRLLATIVPSQRWGVGRVPHGRWRLYFKGGWSSGTGLVDHQVALYAAGQERFSLALFTRFDPDHEYGKETLRGLAARLLRGIPRPERRIPRVRTAAMAGGLATIAGAGCTRVSIRPWDEPAQTFATGAPSCAGFRLAAAGERALWAWSDGQDAHLFTAGYSGGPPQEVGEFDLTTDELGVLAGGGGRLAFQHGDEVSVVGGPDCPVPSGASVALGNGMLASAAGTAVDVLDSSSCAPVRSLTASGDVEALALGDDLLAVLARSAGGVLKLERFRISTGAPLGRTRVAPGTLRSLAMRGSRIVCRTPHALRIVAAGSGRSWTVWRPAIRPVAVGLGSRRIAWVEDDGASARLWSLRLTAPKDRR